jgi:rubredoxin
MPRATSCTFNKAQIGVEEALRLHDQSKRDDLTRPDFRCSDCGEAVRPHKDGGNAAAHFEHIKRNAACPLSDPERN